MKSISSLRFQTRLFSLPVIASLFIQAGFFISVQADPVTAPQEAANYFVAPTGNDSNPGTEIQPWRTIQKAADTLVAGETVYIKAGTYNERVVPKNSGSVGNNITYRAYSGDTVTINGNGIPLPDDLAGLFEVSDKSYITISGLRVINTGPYMNNAGILILDSSFVSVENNFTNNTSSSGIGVWGSDHITIDANWIQSAGIGGGQECITVAGTHDFVVGNNTVVNCMKEGIDAKDGSSDGQVYKNLVYNSLAVGIYVEAWDKYTHDIDVFQNTVHDSVESSGITAASEMGGRLENIRIYNNILYGNQSYGIEVSRCCSASHPMNNITIINNTVYDNGIGWGGGIIADNPQAQNVVIRNNITSQNLTFQLAVAADVPAQNVVVDHNLIDGYRGYIDEVYGTDYKEGDPLFANPIQADFHIQQNSPAVDAGSTVAAPVDDFSGNLRDAAPDIGAYEAITTTFTDVPSTYWAYSFIERLYNAGITGGCSASPLMYCPESTVTRAQMAIFILRGIHGSAYVPPAATGTVFDDVPLGSFAADWIEQLAAEGVTAGCGGGNYCPDATITRAQMAIFLLRGEHGSAYTPPPATGTVFGDVPLGSFAADWIEQLAAEGVTSGCGGGNYCPNNPVTRAEMAVFLVRTFNLAPALQIADYLLARQDSNGAIPDAPGWNTVNQDSSMEYALIGLAAAYNHNHDPRYLAALEKGIRWLAGREEMTDPRWRGSWYYAYSSVPPYNPIPISPGDPAIADVRGVDATSALFVYLLYLHSSLSGSNALALEYESHARAALGFLLANNRNPGGFFYSSWQKSAANGEWNLWKFRYAADQGDVYLGMQAGCMLYNVSSYCQSANFLKTNTSPAFFDSSRGRYALGMYEDGALETEMEGFNGIFPQGYLAWVFGENQPSRAAYDWLTACLQTDGSLACFADDPRYSMSGSLYILSASTLGIPSPTQTLNWLVTVPYDPTDGGIHDTADLNSEKFPNVAGFTVMALLEFAAFPPSILANGQVLTTNEPIQKDHVN